MPGLSRLLLPVARTTRPLALALASAEGHRGRPTTPGPLHGSATPGFDLPAPQGSRVRPGGGVAGIGFPPGFRLLHGPGVARMPGGFDSHPASRGWRGWPGLLNGGGVARHRAGAGFPPGSGGGGAAAAPKPGETRPGVASGDRLSRGRRDSAARRRRLPAFPGVGAGRRPNILVLIPAVLPYIAPAGVAKPIKPGWRGRPAAKACVWHLAARPE